MNEKENKENQDPKEEKVPVETVAAEANAKEETIDKELGVDTGDHDSNPTKASEAGPGDEGSQDEGPKDGDEPNTKATAAVVHPDYMVEFEAEDGQPVLAYDPNADPEAKPWVDDPPEQNDVIGSVEGDAGGEQRVRNALPVVGNEREACYTIGLDDNEGGIDLLAYAHGSSPENAIRVFGSVFGNVKYRTEILGWDPKIDGKKVIVIAGDAVAQSKEQ